MPFGEFPGGSAARKGFTMAMCQKHNGDRLQ